MQRFSFLLSVRKQNAYYTVIYSSEKICSNINKIQGSSMAFTGCQSEDQSVLFHDCNLWFYNITGVKNADSLVDEQVV